MCVTESNLASCLDSDSDGDGNFAQGGSTLSSAFRSSRVAEVAGSIWSVLKRGRAFLASKNLQSLN